jgi:hypothetical protein
MATTTLNLVVDGVPYLVKAEPFVFNQEARFRVGYNGNEEFIFAWDEELLRFAAMGDGAATIPDGLERAISDRLKEQFIPYNSR